MATPVRTIEVTTGIRTVTVRAMKVKHIKALLERIISTAPAAAEDASPGGAGLPGIVDLVKSRFGDLVKWSTDLRVEELDELDSVDLDVLWKGFREINAFFFDLAGRAKAGETLSVILEMARTLFIGGFANSLRASSAVGTGTPGTTTEPSSMPPLTKSPKATAPKRTPA